MGKREEKPKFKVGQVLRLVNYGCYLRVTLPYQMAEGVGRGLRWWYKLMKADQINTVEVPETELRALTMRERGR